MKSTPDSTSSGAERRGHARFSDTSPVYVGDGAIARRCALVDVSEGGARIAVGREVQLPPDVVLVDPETGLSQRAKLVWRSETEVGVRFVNQGVRYRVVTSTNDLAWNTARCSRQLAS